MGFVSVISDKRQELIERRASPHLEPGEEIVLWVRSRRVNEKGEGFIFLTERRVIMHWTGNDDGHCIARWDEIDSWGLATDLPGGPVIGIETGHENWYAQIAASKSNMAEDARLFIKKINELAPSPRRRFKDTNDIGRFETDGDVEIDMVKHSVSQMVRRLALTALGAALVIAAVLIIPLPGPWSFVLSIAGLAVLSREYDWAKDLLEWTREKYQQARGKLMDRKRGRASER